MVAKEEKVTLPLLCFPNLMWGAQGGDGGPGGAGGHVIVRSFDPLLFQFVEAKVAPGSKGPHGLPGKTGVGKQSKSALSGPNHLRSDHLIIYSFRSPC